MSEKIVTIATFNDYMQASLAKQMLDDAGIDSFLAGENISVTLPVQAGANIQLQVRHSRALEAMEILKSNKVEEQ